MGYSKLLTPGRDAPIGRDPPRRLVVIEEDALPLGRLSPRYWAASELSGDWR